MASKHFKELEKFDKEKELTADKIDQKEPLKDKHEKEKQEKHEKNEKQEKQEKQEKETKDTKDQKDQKEQKEHKEQKDQKEQKDKHEKEKHEKEQKHEKTEKQEHIDKVPHKEQPKEQLLEHLPMLEAERAAGTAAPTGAAITKFVEHKQIYDKYIHKDKFEKFEIKELKIEKLEFKEHKPEKLEFEVAGPGPVGPGDPVEQRLASLEAAVAQLLHFIPESLRPDLSQGALKQEPDLEKKGASEEKKSAPEPSGKEEKKR